MGKLEDVGSLYERRPYPPVNLFTSLLQPMRRDDLPLLNYQAGYASCYGSLAGAAGKPRILVAGCGTIEPVAVALANPEAEILAVDLSSRSLNKLRWQARLRGVGGRIQTRQADLEEIEDEKFDYVIATGVLHHLVDPVRGLASLVANSAERAIFRMMVYSQWGRDLLYGAKELAKELGLSTPLQIRRMMAALPADHPYRIYFHLYSDSKNDTGLSDGYLHPCDQPFDALSLKKFLANAGLKLGRFLHRPEGQPEAADKLATFKPAHDDWDRLAVLELLGGLEENFHLFAGRSGSRSPAQALVWNPALPSTGRFSSKLTGVELAFDRSVDPATLEAAQVELMKRALFLIPGGA